MNFGIMAKSRGGGVRMNISIPQFSAPIGGNSAPPVMLGPGLNPYYYNTPAYGNLILNQYNANMNAINSRIPQPESDLGAQYLDKQIQKEIADEIAVQPIQPGQSMPTYKITNINDHGKIESNNPKFKNIDYLLWKFQNISEGNSVQFNGNQLELGASIVFTDKPDSLIKFIQKEKENYFLLEDKKAEVLTGFLINRKTKKVAKIQCSKSKVGANYDYAVLGDELEFWSYIGLFTKE